jgi:hypothetical protein
VQGGHVPRHPDHLVATALSSLAAGLTPTEVAAALDVPRCTVLTCGAAYCELLGWYLGDGHIGWSGRRTPQLAIYDDVRYPGLTAGVIRLIDAVAPGTRPYARRRTGRFAISSSWKHLDEHVGPKR